MSRQRTAEEVNQDHIQAMGEALGSLYHALWNELAWLQSRWKAHIVDIVSIYKAADCDMVDAMRHMYCPEGWSRDCRWVYGEVQR